ncbi:P-loop NTPase fold protein [Amycolatopsis sp. NPDC021455]|uniref:P-loop NTPase fold protein n=1 Tax=Amycolatopsis sp. NPDC021455 TaxID=3154901 RepID=UPI00340496A0
MPEDRRRGVENLLRDLVRTDALLSEALTGPDGTSRVLTAVVVADLVGCSPREALDAITDGPGDLGIDAVVIKPDTSQVWLIGVSWADGQTGHITKGTAKLIKAAQGFLDDHLQGTSTILERRLNSAKQVLAEPAATLTVIYVYPGPPVSSPRHADLTADLRTTAGNTTAYFSVMDADGIERAIGRLASRQPPPMEPADSVGNERAIDALATTLAGQEAWSGSLDGVLQRFISQTAERFDFLETNERIVSIAITDDGREALCGDRDGGISRWDLVEKRRTGRIDKAHGGAVTAIRYLAAGRAALSAGTDGRLRRWVLDTGVETRGDHHIKVSKQEIYAFAVTPDESHVITGGADGALRKYDLANDQQIGKDWRGHRMQINAVAMAPDGLEVASASDDGTVCRWRLADGEPLGEPMAGHDGYANAVTYAADGAVLVSVGADGRVVAWDRETGGQLEQLGDHGAPLHCVLTLPSGTTGLAAGNGGLVRWSLNELPPARSDGPAFEQFANVATDKHSSTDSLDMAADVRQMALLLGAREVAPPLSIALMGNWGAGKSSFMSQLSGQVNALATRSARTPGQGPFVSHVRQVWFNAWHYSDDHLWVGLVEHLFQGLTHPGDSPVADPDRRAKLETELATNKAEKERISANLAAIDRVDVRSGWLAPLRAPFRSARIAAAATKGLLHELRRLRAWLTVIVIVSGIVGIVLGVHFGKDLIAAAGGLISVAGTVLGPVRIIKQKMAEWTEQAHKKLVEEKTGIERKIHDCELELDRIAPDRRLTSLLADLADSARYEAFRGLVGRIHRDLRQLDQALVEARKAWKADIGAPPLERIVLYVDDLDRCPPDRVMDVLQAVNLLLTMDLFMVVVAVDPRWLTASIRKHVTTSFATDIAVDEKPVAPLEYLDKIFHIPFAIRPMGNHAGRYMRDLLPASLDLPNGKSKDEPPLVAAVEPTEEDVSVSTDPDEREQPSAQAEDPSPDGASAIPEGGNEVDDAELDPEQLLITMAEQDFLAELSGFLPTPRSVKKFSNLYRLLRLSVPSNQIGEFALHAHRPAAVLLAVLVREPEEAKEVLQQVHALPDDGDVVAALASVLPIDGLVELRDARVTDYKKWAKRVARFGFETYMHFEDR